MLKALVATKFDLISKLNTYMDISFPSKIVRVIAERGFKERLLRQLAPRTSRAMERPTVGDFLAACSKLRWQAPETLDALLGSGWRTFDAEYQGEFKCISRDLEARYEQKSLLFPSTIGWMSNPSLFYTHGFGNKSLKSWLKQ